MVVGNHLRREPGRELLCHPRFVWIVETDLHVGLVVNDAHSAEALRVEAEGGPGCFPGGGHRPFQLRPGLLADPDALHRGFLMEEIDETLDQSGTFIRHVRDCRPADPHRMAGAQDRF